MTQRERRTLLGLAIVLAIACSALFARAVLAQRAADYARAEERSALLALRTSPSSNVADRTMLGWSGATGQVRFWQALQRFEVVGRQAEQAEQYTLAPPLSLVFQVGETETALRKTAVADHSRDRRSRLEDMLGLAYYYDAGLHQGEFPVEPQLLARSATAFRQAVLLDGTNAAAKTNLELALEAQRRAHQAKTPHTAAIPGQSRAQNTLQAAVGHTSNNGAVGKHFAGGY
jgi:hypothetical protein